MQKIETEWPPVDLFQNFEKYSQHFSVKIIWGQLLQALPKVPLCATAQNRTVRPNSLNLRTLRFSADFDYRICRILLDVIRNFEILKYLRYHQLLKVKSYLASDWIFKLTSLVMRAMRSNPAHKLYFIFQLENIFRSNLTFWTFYGRFTNLQSLLDLLLVSFLWLAEKISLKYCIYLSAGRRLSSPSSDGFDIAYAQTV